MDEATGRAGTGGWMIVPYTRHDFFSRAVSPTFSFAATKSRISETSSPSSRPILDALEPWLHEKLGLISQKTKLAEAIRHVLSRWNTLCRFVNDGRIKIDNDVVEGSIRPIALTRKNALFAGSNGGAEHWAVIASLVETCKLSNVDPQAYLADNITRIVNDHPNSRLDDLMPWNYPAAPAPVG